MYSYEDRVRAVKLYIKLGKRPAATIRQLGNRLPTHLNSRIDELLPHLWQPRG